MQENESDLIGQKSIPNLEEHDRQVLQILPDEKTSTKTIEQTNIIVHQNHQAS